MLCISLVNLSSPTSCVCCQASVTSLLSLSEWSYLPYLNSFENNNAQALHDVAVSQKLPLHRKESSNRCVVARVYSVQREHCGRHKHSWIARVLVNGEPDWCAEDRFHLKDPHIIFRQHRSYHCV